MKKRTVLTHKQYYDLRVQITKDMEGKTHTTHTSKELATYYSELFNIHVSVFTVREILNELNITFKRQKTGKLTLLKRVAILEEQVAKLMEGK